MIKFVIVLIKEVAETVIRGFRRFSVRILNKDVIDKIKQEGFTTKQGFYTPEECSNLRKKIDELIEDETVTTWVDDTGSDHRIYFANELHEEFDKFYSNSLIRDALAGYTGTKRPNGMVLAARIDAKEGNVGSGGGWHRDSPVTHQFKAVCYLSNVTKDNGPFQIIKGSHKKMDVLKSYFSGIFHAGQYRFSEREISNYLTYSEREISDFEAPEGTVAFADTKSIHRGKPIKEGSRYVLFCYFWHNEIPSHFAKFRQKR